MGPTASGKTDLAFHLCDQFPFEIVSVDSVLVYAGMDIGTAKPTKAEQARYPHHLVDIEDAKNPFSVATFCDLALIAIEAIHQKNKIPLLVGGTMLYFRALMEGLSSLPAKDDAVREKIAKMAEAGGWSAVHDELKKVDPVTAARLHPNDSQRLQRALEVYLITQKTLTSFHTSCYKSVEKPFSFNVLQLALLPQNRALLHARIEQRFHQMMVLGLLDEVHILFNRGDLTEDLPAIRSVGYRQAWQYLQGITTEKEMIEKGIAATRQLAKRQITWLRGWSNLVSFDCFDAQLKEKVVQSVETFLAS